MNLERKEGETEIQYLWRIGKMVDSGQVGSWKDIAPMLNKQLREEDEYYDESAYRKKYQAAKKFYEEIFSKHKQLMKEHFLMAFEIEDDMEGKLTYLINKYFDDVSYRFSKDIYNKMRFLYIIK